MTEREPLSRLLKQYQQLPEFLGVPLDTANTRGSFDSMPLHIAIHRKSPEEVRTLLFAGADPNAPGEYGELPLDIAIRRNRFDIVEQLLEFGANCELPDRLGRTAWDAARSEAKTDELAKAVEISKRKS